jgi:tetrahydromethanopterin S-methyltransferase subunit G
MYHYMLTNKFAVTNLVGIPVTSLFFLCTRFFHRRTPGGEYERQVQRFFNQMETPVDFEREVGKDNTQAQARVLGRVMGVYGLLVGLILLVPNSAGGRVAVAACAGLMLAIGGGLLFYARRIAQEKAAAASSEPASARPDSPN